MNQPRQFFAIHPQDDTRLIKVIEGETGYYPLSTYADPSEAVETLNRFEGVSEAEAQAAVVCSMFGCWQNFERIAGGAA